MVKANELKIGNWVFELANVRVMGIQSDGINTEEAVTSRIPLDMLCGIPLTYEILDKCGLEYKPTAKRGLSEDFKIFSIQVANNTYLEYSEETGVEVMTGASLTVNEWKIVNEFDSLGAEFWGELKYLHQLQNLYFALAGEELNISI